MNNKRHVNRSRSPCPPYFISVTGPFEVIKVLVFLFVKRSYFIFGEFRFKEYTKEICDLSRTLHPSRTIRTRKLYLIEFIKGESEL